MMTLFVVLLAAMVLVALLAARRNWRGIGFVLTGFGLFLLAHAGISIAAIVANKNIVPTWVNYYLLFATIPAGTLLLGAGLMVFCIRACAARCRDRSR
jgi:hypothetical protein